MEEKQGVVDCVEDVEIIAYCGANVINSSLYNAYNAVPIVNAALQHIIHIPIQINRQRIMIFNHHHIKSTNNHAIRESLRTIFDWSLEYAYEEEEDSC